MNAAIQSRIPKAEYVAIDAMNISRLKELKRSPQHYQWALTHPKTSDAMTLGIATHVATLEPERFVREFAVWTNRTDSGRMSPRTGSKWQAFLDENEGATILTETEADTALGIAAAVRANALARLYLESGEPEVTLEWMVGERPAKGRIDWITRVAGAPVLVGLKTTRDCRPYLFGSQAAKLGYHLQWAWYHDGWQAIKGAPARMVEIVVESEPPHAVAVYAISSDVIEQGREEYQGLLKVLAECEATNTWLGPVPMEEFLSLPSWAYPQTEDDIAELGLVE
jgi:hypothetical protein